MKKTWIRTLFCRINPLFALVAMLAAPPACAADKPNIILFIADDMTWFDAGCYGSPDVKTPHLDKLASQGMRFKHCSTATAMCAPTRQQLYTGLYPVRSGAYPNHSAVKQGTKSLGHHFKALGYRVAISGKKHYKPASSYPFETLAGGRPHDSGKSDKKDLNIQAIEQFIRRDTTKPYFLICATNQPHAPWNRGDASAYDPATLTLPPYLVDTKKTREDITRYYAEITYADALLGEVMAALEKSGEADNTIVLFTSEQGSQMPFGKWTCYEAGLRTGLVVRWPGKIKPASTTDAMVQYVDVVPTLIDAAGGDPTEYDTGRPGAPGGGQGFDGTSFLPVLQGEADTHRTHAFGVHTTRGIINGSDCCPIRSVRNQRYKLIRNLNHETPFKNILMSSTRDLIWKDWTAAANNGNEQAKRLTHRYQHRPAVELYDLQEDPHEMNNLADDPALNKVKQTLGDELDKWMQQQGDKGIETEMLAKPR